MAEPGSAEPTVPAAAVSEPTAPAEPEVPSGVPELQVPLATPEPAFAARVTPPPPPPPLPSTRRAVFFDVENTSRAEHVGQMLEHLAIDRVGCRTEFVAVGNWRVIGPDTGRLLAHHGAQLVHSAPSTGVRDWSDLRIAVSAGVWMAGARPGDMLEIVSEDRAFDAVGDVAVSLGIAFRRISYRALTGAPAVAEAKTQSAAERSRRGRGRRPGHREPAAHHAPAHGRPATPAAVPEGEAGAHTAPHDEVVELVRELARRSPSGSVLIDTVANALKTRGFSRPPGSPRLITRLRRMRDLSVSPTGMISLAEPSTDGRQPQAFEAPATVEPTAASAEAGAPQAQKRRRRSRRGGRRRRRGPASAPAPGS
ncbi:MAG TPA: hypothetical protein VFR64_08980 [Methylomirabilota bacterium]|nr:hypothetical protein [Methylomirabilota bacterium]